MAAGSFTGYRALVRNADHRFLLASGLVARIPMGMRALGVLLTISAMTGSYAVAGAAAGLGTATQALVAPRWAHLSRRHGHARIVGWSVALSASLTIALVVAASLDVDAWALIVLAGLSGACVLPVGALSRGVWESVLDPRGRDSAFALEGVFDEVAYVAGPALVVALEYAVAPGAGLMAATMLYLVGGVATASRVGRVHPSPSGVVPQSRTLRVLAEPGVLVLVVAYLLIGGFFGALDVGIVARAEAAGEGASAGWLLAVLGATSVRGSPTGSSRGLSRPALAWSWRPAC